MGNRIGKENLIYVQNVSLKTCLNYPGIPTFGNGVASHVPRSLRRNSSVSEVGPLQWLLISLVHTYGLNPAPFSGHCSGWGPVLGLTQQG